MSSAEIMAQIERVKQEIVIVKKKIEKCKLLILKLEEIKSNFNNCVNNLSITAENLYYGLSDNGNSLAADNVEKRKNNFNSYYEITSGAYIKAKNQLIKLENKLAELHQELMALQEALAAALAAEAEAAAAAEASYWSSKEK